MTRVFQPTPRHHPDLALGLARSLFFENPFLPKSILQKIRERGLVSAIEIQFNRVIPPWLFRFSIGDVFELDTHRLCELNEQSPKDDLHFRCVTDAAEWEQLRATTYNSVPVETIQNDFGFAISHADSPDRIGGGVWGGVVSFIESNLGFQMELESDQAWIYCAYIQENTRGRGVYQRLLAFAASHLRDHGFQRLYVVIQPWNHASIHVHRKYAIGRVGRITAVRVLRLASVFASGSLIKSRIGTTQPGTRPISIRLP